MRPRLPRRVAAATTALLAMTSIAGTTTLPAAASQDQRAAAARWYHSVVAVLQPLQTTLPSGLQAAGAWQQGSETAADAAREFNRDLPRLVQAYDRLARVRPLIGHRATRDDYVAGIGLYVEAFRLGRTATGLSPGPVVTQLQLSFARIRQLGDVTFDEGTAQLAGLLEPSIAGPDVQAASHIPEWSAGIAPGEPLVSAWPGAAPPSSGPQPRANWATAVANDGAPSQSSVRAVLAKTPTHPAQLAALAVALGQAAGSLATVPGPVRAPHVPALARLGLLVDAEAMLAGEAGDLAGTRAAGTLGKTAVTVASIGSILRTESGSAH